MTSKIYRSAQGKMVDLGALILKNETERAVSNVNINARGDMIDNMNRPISTKNQEVSQHYRNNSKISHDPVMDSRKKDSK